MRIISCDRKLIKEYIWKITLALMIFEKSLGVSSSSKLHNVYNLSGVLMLMGMLVVILMTKYTLRQYIVFFTYVCGVWYGHNMFTQDYYDISCICNICS